MGRAQRRQSPAEAMLERLSIINPDMPPSWFLFSGADIELFRLALAALSETGRNG